MAHENEDRGDLTPRETREYKVGVGYGRFVTVEIECPVSMSEGMSRMLVRGRFGERVVRSVSAPRVIDTAVYE